MNWEELNVGNIYNIHRKEFTKTIKTSFGNRHTESRESVKSGRLIEKIESNHKLTFEFPDESQIGFWFDDMGKKKHGVFKIT